MQVVDAVRQLAVKYTPLALLVKVTFPALSDTSVSSM